MSISALTSISGTLSAAAAAPTASATSGPAGLANTVTAAAAGGSPSGLGSVGESGGSGFGGMVSDALNKLSSVQGKADNLAQQVATGDLNEVHDYMIAATEATVATELTLAVRNKVVDAFNQIMQMPV